MKNITLCPGGTYRWVYEFRLMKNPIVFGTVVTVLGLSALIVGAFQLIIDLFAGNLNAASLRGTAVTVLITLGILLALSVIAYLIVAAVYGWKYCVLFEMDEKGVRHIQMPKQFKKAQALGWLTAMAGAAAGNPGTAGAGLLAGSKMASTTEFSKVRRMKVYRKYETIKLNMLLEHNQIYVPAEDFDFVLGYISERIPEKAK